MIRVFLLFLGVCTAVTNLAGAAPLPTYVNNSVVSSPLQIPQEVGNFVNRGIISISTATPFETFGTLNYTNEGNAPYSGLIIGRGGFSFAYNPLTSGNRRWASSFYNGELAAVEAEDPPPPSLLPRSMLGSSLLRIWATNIVTGGGSEYTGNPGARASLIVGANGWMDIWGGNVDASRSALQVLPIESVGSANSIDQGVFSPDVAIEDRAAVTGDFAPDPPAARINSAALWNGTEATSLSAPTVGASVVPSFRLNNPHAGFYIAGDPQTLGSMTVTNFIVNFDPAFFTPVSTREVPQTNFVIVPRYYYETNSVFTTNFISGTFEVALGTVTNIVALFTNEFSFTNLFATNLFTTNIAVITNTIIEGNIFDPAAVTMSTRQIRFYTNTIKGAVFVQGPPGFTVSHGIGNPGNRAVNGAQAFQVSIATAVPNAATAMDEFEAIIVQDTLAPFEERGLLANVLGATRPPQTGSSRPVNFIVSRSRGADTNSVTGSGTNTQGLLNIPTTTISDPPAANFFTTVGLRDPRFAFFDSTGTVLNDNVTNSAAGNGSYAAYSAFVDNIVEREINSPFASETNRTGRITITADRLNLSDTRIRAAGYLSIKTPHLILNTNTVIDCESLTFDVSSTNSTLLFRNLSKDYVQRLRGTVTAWSAVWQSSSFLILDSYVLTNGAVTITNIVGTNEVVLTNLVAERSILTNELFVLYHTLMVDGRNLGTNVPVSVHELTMRNPNVIMDDNATVTRKFFTTARSLTLNGDLNLTLTESGTIPGLALGSWFRTNAPQLAFFTNNGNLYVPGEAHFGDDGGGAYSTWVNRGSVLSSSVHFDSSYFANEGTIQAYAGVLTMQGGSGWLGGGASLSEGDTTIKSRNLQLALYGLYSFAGLNLWVSNHLSDLGPDYPNQLETLNGFNLWVKPTTGDLLGTWFQSVAPNIPFPRPIHRWSGVDRGASPGGFVDNAAIGILTLNTTNHLNPSSPRFVFRGTGVNNAMYVDLLDLSQLEDYASQLIIEPNLTIYYARADLSFNPPDVDGVPQTAEEFLDGQFGGRLRWVPGFAGPNSSTTVTIDGESVVVNSGLAQSWSNRGIDPSTDFQRRALSLEVYGNGTVNPFADGQLLIVGTTNTITAQPGPGAKFLGWFGSIESSSPELTFTMEEGLNLIAVFSFAPQAATYTGLFMEETNSLELDRAGSITITTTKSGKYSGFVQLASGKYSLSGQLDEGGYDARSIGRAGLYMEIQAGADKIYGTIGNGDWTGVIDANRVIFDGKVNKAPHAGRYTIVFPGSGDVTNIFLPGGDGFGTVTVDARGNVKLAGSLADGTKISQSTTISGEGYWPLFVGLNKGQGHLISWQSFADAGGDVAGTYNWIKAPSGSALYSDGFNHTANAFGSRFNPSLSLNTLFPDALVELTGAGLTSNLNANVLISGKNKITVIGPNKVTFSFNKAQGTFKGRMPVPDSRKPINFNGVVLQKHGFGSGYFLNSNQSGRVVIQPAP